VHLTFLDKLQICYGILTYKENFSLKSKIVDKQNKKQFIFSKGYTAGLQDKKQPGVFVLKAVDIHNGTETNLDFTDITSLKTYLKVQMKNDNFYNYIYSLEQTFLNKEANYFLPAELRSV